MAQDASQPHQTDLDQLLQALPVLVAHISSDFEILYANHGYRDWFGLDPAAQYGKHLKDVIGRQAFRVLLPHFNQALAGERAEFHGEVPYVRGGPRFIHGTYIPSHDDSGRINGFYILSVDLSREQALERQLTSTTRRAETIINTAMDGIITIDETGTVHSFNPAAERIFGYGAGEVIGQNIRMLMAGRDHDHHDQYLANYLKTGEARIIGIGREVCGRRRDGTLIDLLLSVAKFEEAGRRMFVGFTHDLTERNRARLEAQRNLDQLAHLNRVNGLGELAASLAHEIRQPLMAIQASAHTIYHSQGSKDQERAFNEALKRIERQSSRANDILKQLTAFLRKTDDSPGEQVDIASLVREVFGLLDPDARMTQVRVELEAPDQPCLVTANRVQLQQVLFNLISNALDAMEVISTPHTIRIRIHQLDGRDTCHVEVMDSGPGLDEMTMDKLFDPFFTTKVHGLGQGLPICRSIIRRHGGELEAGNHPEGGAHFRFTLPLSGDQHARD
ncbi:PAS domain S-box protein [Gammaproteobacteria bacterium AB-CW1]|uniref:Sensor protein FixL n=1 Tax=Natronospira elongata TaxID=3110268 RepID=A0AAP6JG17_9GAMM|nr:PAS domain S-box protein [Gammaproteobacteria bacterium AB-CW1]